MGNARDSVARGLRAADLPKAVSRRACATRPDARTALVPVAMSNDRFL